jgi:hypothetical protein
MDYCCTTCKKDFKQKSNLLSHLRRKKPCIVLNIDTTTSITENIIIAPKSNLIAPKSNLIAPKSNLIAPKSNLIAPKSNLIGNIDKIEEDKLKCEHCNKKFSRRYSLNRHINNRCKNKNNNDNNNIIIEKLKELLLTKTKTKSTKNITNIETQNNSNIQTQNQTNITINFGEEDIKKLTECEILTSLKSLSNCFQNFVKVIHLNDRLPEYSNILINNMRSDFGSIIEDGILVTKNKNKIITDLISMRLEDIEEVSNDYQNKLSKREFSYIVDMIDFLKNNYIETEDVDGNIVKGEKTKVKKLKDIHKQLQYLFYDNRSIVLNNMKKNLHNL